MGETVRETYNRLKGLYRRWMRPETKTKEEMAETLILKQYLRVLHPDVRAWVKEHQTTTGEEAAQLVERYLAAHREPPRPYKVTVGRGRSEGSKVDEGLSKQESGGRARSNYSTAGLICFNCHQPGRKAASCLLKKTKEANMCMERSLVENLETIQKIPRPQTKRQVRSSLGLIGWYRRFVPHFATLATPITNLTQKTYSSHLSWTEECEEAFDKLKELLCQDYVLQSPDFTKKFLVQVASDVGLGVVLAQGEPGEEKPILFLSRKTP